MNRAIAAIHRAEYRPIDQLITYSPLPIGKLKHLDPFLFLNHHGPQVYPENNNGLPFGPHPHRGIETVTFILDGAISHKDSSGSESVIESGGIQWMTAGKGLIHSENSSETFRRTGGLIEILQLWINLPAKLKMTAPFYKGLQNSEIPVVRLAEGIEMQLVSGDYQNKQGPIDSITDIFLSCISAKKSGPVELNVAGEQEVFFYVVRGRVRFDQENIEKLNLIQFDREGETLSFSMESGSIIIFGFGKPFNEPIVAYGPFVMNTLDEIKEAYDDYAAGKFGSWNS